MSTIVLFRSCVKDGHLGGRHVTPEIVARRSGFKLSVFQGERLIPGIYLVGKKVTATFFSAGENGGRFTVKKYHSELSIGSAVTADGWRHDRIQLLPLNPAFEPITLEPEEAGDLMIAGDVSATSSSSSITWD